MLKIVGDTSSGFSLDSPQNVLILLLKNKIYSSYSSCKSQLFWLIFLEFQKFLLMHITVIRWNYCRFTLKHKD